ncbi:MAG: NAD(P)/FAD-dependent oxidoreductase [Gammaproteobacteria bacterium]
MKIAIIGSGISGLTAAYYLHKKHEVVIFEAQERIGGHTATVDVTLGDQQYSIDTGFIVFNDWTYPQFIKMMNEVGVGSQLSDMSFSVSCETTGLEFAGLDGKFNLFNGLFAQRKNLLSPSYINMLLDIVRFNKIAISDVKNQQIDPDISLQDYVKKYRLGVFFRDYYLIPMASAIWSTPFKQMLDFPMRFMLPFMFNHGLLSVNERPKWRTIVGGSSQYIGPLCAGFKHNIRLNTPVHNVRRYADHVDVSSLGNTERFDQVIFACHSDQSLEILEEPNAAEKSVLEAVGYQSNEVVLHTDVSQLPKNSRAWASWNYRLTPGGENELPKLTYDMNRLMSIESQERFCVTLNNTAAIAPERILRKFEYSHPIFTQQGVEAQARWHEVNGVQRTWFCGAWWGKGFHEDAVVSAKRVVEALEVSA